MQNTLLAIAIAAIIVLVAALIGPFWIDWDAHRARFEAEAGRIIGAPVRVGGPITARLLPTPSLSMTGIEIGADPSRPAASAERLALTVGFTGLLRGEVRVEEAVLTRPAFHLVLDADGKLASGPLPNVASLAEVAVQRFEIVDGLVTVRRGDEAPVEIAQIAFLGEARTLAGPLRGDGRARVAGREITFRVAATQADGAAKLRLTLGLDAARAVDLDGSLTVRDGRPAFDGGFALLVAPSAARPGALPFRLTAQVKATPVGATAPLAEILLGSDERPLRLTGTGSAEWRGRPRLDLALKARQLDLDRMVSLPEETRREPLRVLSALLPSFTGSDDPGLDAALAIEVPQMVVAGALVTDVAARVAVGGAGWRIETLSAQLPGRGQFTLQGTVTAGTDTLYAGTVAADIAEPAALAAWIEGRDGVAAQRRATDRLKFDAKLAVKTDSVVVEALKGALGEAGFKGNGDYATLPDGRRRLAARIDAGALDIEALQRLSLALGIDPAADIDVALDLRAGQVSAGDLALRAVLVKAGLSRGRLTLEDVRIGDVGGAALSGRAVLDNALLAPSGTATFTVKGEKLDALAPLIARLPGAGPLAAILQPRLPVLAPADLAATLRLAEGSIAQLSVEGRLARQALDLKLDSPPAGGPWAQRPLKLAASLKGAGPEGLLALLGLPAATGIAGPLDLSVQASGVPARELATKAALTIPAGTIGFDGQLRSDENADLIGKGRLTARLADARPFAQALGIVAAGQVPLRLDTALAFDPLEVKAEAIDAEIAGVKTSGRLVFATKPERRIDGALRLARLDLATIAGIGLGVPPIVPGGATLWPTAPFGPHPLAGIAGEVALTIDRLGLGGERAATNVKAVFRAVRDEIAFEEITGRGLDGELEGALVLARRADIATATVRFKARGANPAAMLGRPAGAPLAGKVDLTLDATGTGRTVAAIVASLTGGGTVKLGNARIAGLDPRAFDAAFALAEAKPDADGKTQLNEEKLGAAFLPALNGGPLTVPQAEAAFAIAGGTIRLRGAPLAAQPVAVTGSLSIDLRNATMEAETVMTAPRPAGDATPGAPVVTIVDAGPLTAPKRAVELGPLIGYLTIRGLDREIQRLETLERERIERMRRLQNEPKPAPVALPPAPAAPAAPPPAAEPPAAVRPAPEPRPVPEARPTPEPRAAPEARPAPETRPAPEPRPAPPAQSAPHSETPPAATAPPSVRTPLPRRTLSESEREALLERIRKAYELAPPSAPEPERSAPRPAAPPLPPPIDIRPAPQIR